MKKMAKIFTLLGNDEEAKFLMSYSPSSSPYKIDFLENSKENFSMNEMIGNSNKWTRIYWMTIINAFVMLLIALLLFSTGIIKSDS